jgi:hypothetical protein
MIADPQSNVDRPPNGDFIGLILGAISVQYFENIFASSSLGAHTVVSLEREDGVQLAHYPSSSDLSGASSQSGRRALERGGNNREKTGSMVE